MADNKVNSSDSERRLRRELVFDLRFRQGLSLRQIAVKLAQMQPPILVSVETIHKDVCWVQGHDREQL